MIEIITDIDPGQQDCGGQQLLQPCRDAGYLFRIQGIVRGQANV